MRLASILLCLTSLLLVRVASAQKAPKLPPTLLGRWQTRQVNLHVTRAVPGTLRRKLDYSKIANLNDGLLSGYTRLMVDFRTDSTYNFIILRGAEIIRFETGTFSLRGSQLFASAPDSPDGSSFHDQQVRKLTRTALTLAFPAGPEMAGVEQAVEYSRVGAYPTDFH